MACANRMVSTSKERPFQDHLWRFPFLATQVTESALARPFLIPSSQGRVQGGEHRGQADFPVAFRWPFARLFALKDGQRRLQDGFWTRLRQFKFKMEPGRPKAPPRFSQDGSKALLRRPMTDPKSMKIHEKWVLRAIPILVSFFARFLIDFQSIFDPRNIFF